MRYINPRFTCLLISVCVCMSLSVCISVCVSV